MHEHEQLRRFIDWGRPSTSGWTEGKRCDVWKTLFLFTALEALTKYLVARYLLNLSFSSRITHRESSRADEFTPRETHITRLLLSFSGCSTAASHNDAVVGGECTEPSQRFQVIVVSLQQAVGNPVPLIWELKGAVFYCSSNNVLPAPSAPPPGALW